MDKSENFANQPAIFNALLSTLRSPLEGNSLSLSDDVFLLESMWITRNMQSNPEIVSPRKFLSREHSRSVGT